jgi:hypothetical protein
MSKWAMRTNFKHLHFNSFPKNEANGFWPLQSRSKNSRVHLGLQLPTWEFTWECEGSFPHTFYTPRSMWCDSKVSLLARNLVTSWPVTLQPLALVVIPKLRLRQFWWMFVHFDQIFSLTFGQKCHLNSQM